MVYIIQALECGAGGHCRTSAPRCDPAQKPVDTSGNLISNENKYEVRSLFKVVSRSADLRYPDEGWRGWDGDEGGWSPHLPPPSFSLLSCFLNSCQESLMAVEFGQEKSGAGSFRGSGVLCLTNAAPLFVFSWAERERDRHRGRKTEEERHWAFSKNSARLMGKQTSDGPWSFNLIYIQYRDTRPTNMWRNTTHTITHYHSITQHLHLLPNWNEIFSITYTRIRPQLSCFSLPLHTVVDTCCPVSLCQEMARFIFNT